MFMKYLLPLLAITVYAPQLIAEGLVNCHPYYQLFTSCEAASQKVIAKPYSIQINDTTRILDSEFHFEYTFNCNDRKLPLYWQTGDTHERVRTNDRWTKTVQTGSKPPSLFQSSTDREEGKRHVFSNYCEVLVRNVAIKPSPATLKAWRAEIFELTEKTVDATYTLDKLNDLILLQSAYQFIANLSDIFLDELSSEDRQEIFINTEEDRRILQQVIDTSEDLDQESAAALSHLLSTLSSLTSDREWVHEDGSPKSLSDFLSKEEQDILKAVSERLDNEQHYHRKRLELYKKMSLWQENISQLNRLLSQWQGE